MGEKLGALGAAEVAAAGISDITSPLLVLLAPVATEGRTGPGWVAGDARWVGCACALCRGRGMFAGGCLKVGRLSWASW